MKGIYMVLLLGGWCGDHAAMAQEPRAGFRVDNPYAHVDWDGVLRIGSTTHVHVQDQKELEQAYVGMGLRHLPISNYYPSVPYYPVDSLRMGQFRVSQDIEVQFKPPGAEQPQALKETIHWNTLIMDPESGWYDQLPEELQQELPFEAGELAFTDVPVDLIFSPNAEHHSFTNTELHANSVGSLYASGTFDAWNKFGTVDQGYLLGTALPWQEAFKRMIDGLIYPDGGGITINHPVWSHLTDEEVMTMLEYDEAVLGIEIYNDPDGGYQHREEAWAIAMWDRLLAQGYRCFGFCVPDHTVNHGQSILLLPEHTEYAALRAYRQGTFYGALLGNGLAFDRIELSGDVLSVETNSPVVMLVITDQGRHRFVDTQQVRYEIPRDAQGQPAVKYVRIEAEDRDGERLFSQPIRFL